jgi:replicative DNA helicase
MSREMDWLTWEQAYREEEENRLNIDVKKLCHYGIPALDDPLMAIAKNELVVIGADTGTGKSELVLHIARHNAKNGKKVALFYLEGGHLEAIQRMKWRDICDLYFKQRQEHEFIEMDYRKWMFNQLDKKRLTELSAQVYEKYKEKYQDNLYLFPVKNDFKIDNFLSALLDFHTLNFSKNGENKFHIDLVIIDHLQYFSLDKDENEISEITKILRQVKDITDWGNLPIILVSHLRKKGKDRGLPGVEDFYGSSNIPKIATTAITIAPDTKEDNLHENIFPTYFRIVKSRIGVRPNYAMLCNFDLTQRKYNDEYKMVKLDNMGNILPELTLNQLPKWKKPYERKTPYED